MTPRAIAHRFVTEVPRDIEAGVLYVSIPYGTAVHRCPGCERKVATPFAPGSWNLIFDGETVSIFPSIRTRAHGCGSHYWIRHDTLIEAFDELPDQSEQATAGAGRRTPDALSWLGRGRAIARDPDAGPSEPAVSRDPSPYNDKLLPAQGEGEE